MIVLTAIASIAIFCSAFWILGIARVGSEGLASTRGAFAVLRDGGLDDREREKAIQRASLRLFGVFLSILLRSVLALAVSFLPIGLASLAGWVEVGEVFQFLARWDVILIGSAAVTLGYFAWIRIRHSK